MTANTVLTPRWTKMRDHPTQIAMMRSRARFNVVPAGRRSGKTELMGKRKLVARALFCHVKGHKYYVPYSDPRFAVGAPTRDQAKRIYWADLKRLIPKTFLAKQPNETQLILQLKNGAEIHVLGLDKPERAEGTPWDHIVLDEFGNMKKETWGQHIRPGLADRNGSCDFIGVPEGRNHYWNLYNDARAVELAAQNEKTEPEWRTFHWFSADIVPPEEIEAAKRDLDDLTYQQEYEGSFINFTGRAYYPFLEHTHCAGLQYDPRAKLSFCFDFNVEPGCAAVIQEQLLPSGLIGTGVIGEVWIPRGSNTVMVTRRLVQDWGGHQGHVVCYGDATGGARHSSGILGSDWQLVKEVLWSHFPRSQVKMDVGRQNPAERERVNSVNARLLSVSGEIKLMVDPKQAPHVVKDFEGVTVVEGGTGELDKKADLDLTHISDAIGYYMWRKFPVRQTYTRRGLVHWK